MTEEQVNGASADASAGTEALADTEAEATVEESVAEEAAEEEVSADSEAEEITDAEAEAADVDAADDAQAEAIEESEPSDEMADADAEATAEALDEPEIAEAATEDAEEPASEEVEETDTVAEADAASETAAVVDTEAQAEVEAVKADEESQPQDSLETDEAAATEEVPDDDRQWYVIHCYSGYENKVRHAIEQRIETMDMQDKIFEVVVPTEEEIEVKDGKRRTVERRVFPGYILVQMMMDEDSWYVVRNTPGVTGFVGMGNRPTPLRPEEVSQIIKRMEAEAPKIKVTFKEGQKIRIIDGPFNDFIGTVDEIDMDKGKVRALVNFFGRDTPVELDFLQVEKA